MSFLQRIARPYESRSVNRSADFFKSVHFSRRLFTSSTPYYMDRSQESGLSDLQRLCSTSDRESTWLYDHKGRWYCITTDYIDYYNDGQLSGNHHPTFNFARLGREITHTHIHPEVLRKMTLFDIVQQHGNIPLCVAQKNLNFIDMTIYSLPSEGDFRAYAAIAQSMRNENVRLRFQVVSRIGATEIELPDSHAINFKAFNQARTAVAEGLMLDYFHTPMAEQTFMEKFAAGMQERLGNNISVKPIIIQPVYSRLERLINWLE